MARDDLPDVFAAKHTRSEQQRAAEGQRGQAKAPLRGGGGGGGHARAEHAVGG